MGGCSWVIIDMKRVNCKHLTANSTNSCLILESQIVFSFSLSSALTVNSFSSLGSSNVNTVIRWGTRSSGQSACVLLQENAARSTQEGGCNSNNNDNDNNNNNNTEHAFFFCSSLFTFHLLLFGL